MHAYMYIQNLLFSTEWYDTCLEIRSCDLSQLLCSRMHNTGCKSSYIPKTFFSVHLFGGEALRRHTF